MATEYFPFISETVPPVVSFTITDTPGNELPNRSVTVPETFRSVSCACKPEAHIVASNKNMPTGILNDFLLFIYNLDCFFQHFISPCFYSIYCGFNSYIGNNTYALSFFSIRIIYTDPRNHGS